MKMSLKSHEIPFKLPTRGHGFFKSCFIQIFFYRYGPTVSGVGPPADAFGRRYWWQTTLLSDLSEKKKLCGDQKKNS